MLRCELSKNPRTVHLERAGAFDTVQSVRICDGLPGAILPGQTHCMWIRCCVIKPVGEGIMNHRRCLAIIGLVFWPAAVAFGSGADVIYSNCNDVFHTGVVNSVHGYAIGSVTCNIG